jgi:hypothetical protein
MILSSDAAGTLRNAETRRIDQDMRKLPLIAVASSYEHEFGFEKVLFIHIRSFYIRE